MLVCSSAMAEDGKPWTFSYIFDADRLGHSPLLNEEPEFRELLEQIQGLINEGEYDDVSQILQDEISRLSINTDNRFDFEKAWALINIDAALDYLLLDNRQQGLNKQYMALYLYTRALSDGIMAEYNHNREQAYRVQWYLHFIVLTTLKNDSYPAIMSLLKNGNYNTDYSEPLSRFIIFAQSLTGFNFPSYYDEESSSWRDYPDLLFSRDEEIEIPVAEYFYENDENRPFYGGWDKNEVMQTFSEDLSYMADFSGDIRIFASLSFIDGARRAASAVDAGIPIENVVPHTHPFSPSQELFVCTTFRKARAQAFFEHYYSGR
jgi:hypothetical protein